MHVNGVSSLAGTKNWQWPLKVLSCEAGFIRGAGGVLFMRCSTPTVTFINIMYLRVVNSQDDNGVSVRQFSV